jgi:hypothetical protein
MYASLVFGPPLVGNQELRVRVNTTPERVKEPKQWTIGNPDKSDGLLAWVCPADGSPCDFATGGTVTFTRADDESIEGQANLTFQSGNTVASRLSATWVARTKQPRQSFCR